MPVAASRDRAQLDAALEGAAVEVIRVRFASEGKSMPRSAAAFTQRAIRVDEAYHGKDRDAIARHLCSARRAIDAENNRGMPGAFPDAADGMARGPDEACTSKPSRRWHDAIAAERRMRSQLGT